MRRAFEEEIRDVMHAAAAKNDSICLSIIGTAGMGKTALISRCRQALRERGVVVYHAAVRAHDAVTPYEPLLRLVGRGLDCPDREDSSGNDALRRLTRHLREVSRRERVAIALDDMQWIDQSTALAFRVLVDTMADRGVLWMLGSRPPVAGSVAHVLQEWLSHKAELPHVVRVLPPLTQGEVESVAAHVFDALPDRSLRATLEGCGGNPTVVSATARALQEQGRVVVSDGIAECPSPIASPLGLDMFALGLDSLSPQAYRLLGSAAVLTEPFTLEQVSVAAGDPMALCVAGLHEAIAAGVLTEDDEGIWFVQDVTRRHFRDALPVSIRRALPPTVRQPAPLESAWAASGGRFIRPPTAGEEVAFDIVGRAVRDLEERSPAAAARLLVHASKALPTTSPHFPELVARAAPLVASVGEFEDLEALVDLTSSAPFSADHRTDITIGVVEGLSHQGKHTEVVTHSVAALAQGPLSSRQRASLLAFQAHARLSTSECQDLADVEDLATQALAEATSSRHTPAEVLALVVSSLVHHARGELPRAVDVAAEAVRRAEHSPGARRMHPGLTYARALLAVDRVEDAEQVLTSGQQTATALGTTWSQPLWHRVRAELLLGKGRIPDALTECEQGLLRAGSASSALPSLHLIRAWCLVGLGQLDQAEQSVSEAERHSTERFPAQLAWTRVWLAHLAGDRFRLSRLLRRAVRRPLTSTTAPTASPILAISVVRTLLAEGHRSIAGQLAEQLVALARSNPGIGSRQALARHAEGLLRGEAAAVDDAVDRYRAAGLLWCVPWAFVDLAVLRAAAGEGDAAVSSYRTALRMFTEHGNFLGVTMADEALQSLRASRTATVTDGLALDALSPAERRVVELVAAGHTNRQVATLLTLSPHTVDSHLRHIFTKVGVANRVQLSAAFHAAGATESRRPEPVQAAATSRGSIDRLAAGVAGFSVDSGHKHRVADAGRP